jgi:hypothetical protein
MELLIVDFGLLFVHLFDYAYKIGVRVSLAGFAFRHIGFFDEMQ